MSKSIDDMIIIVWWQNDMITYILFMMIQIDRQTDQSSKVGQPWLAYFRKWSCLLIIYVAYYQVSKYYMKGCLIQEVKNNFTSIGASNVHWKML